MSRTAEAATSPRPPVFVRGLGAVTPLGHGWPASWRALVRGECAIRPVTHFDVEGFPSTVAAPVVTPPESDDRRLPLALAAAGEAWTEAHVSAPPERIGVFVGAESARPPFSTVVSLAKWAAGAERDSHGLVSPNGGAEQRGPLARGVTAARVAALLARLVGAHGPAQTICLACASSAVAIAEGARAIEQGHCDVVLCGGVGADVDPFMMAGFGLLGALSASGISRPFDGRRDGFVLGEAAVFAVLARDAGGATVRLLGSGRSVDAHHITAPDPRGVGAELAMRRALAHAGLDRVEVVQAHGTSTLQNDAVEAAALRRLFPLGSGPKVSSVKGAVGHTIAAAGALGFACAVGAIEHGAVVPTVGLAQVDVDCELDHVMVHAHHAPVDSVMVNSFAFGGANCSLVLARA